jgi:hypothetical protein
MVMAAVVVEGEARVSALMAACTTFLMAMRPDCIVNSSSSVVDMMITHQMTLTLLSAVNKDTNILRVGLL